MALEAETKAIVSQFDYPDHELNMGVLEFLRQMSKLAFPCVTASASRQLRADPC